MFEFEFTRAALLNTSQKYSSEKMVRVISISEITGHIAFTIGFVGVFTVLLIL